MLHRPMLALLGVVIGELWKLDELTPRAEEWFMESGPLHYREHLPDLERFVKESSA